MPVVLTEGLDRNRKGWQSVCVLHCPIQPVRFRVSIHCDWLLYHRYFTLWSEADKLVPRVVSYVIIFFPSLLRCFIYARFIINLFVFILMFVRFHQKLLFFYFQQENIYLICDFVFLCAYFAKEKSKITLSLPNFKYKTNF